jgi:5-methylcytosine-specific restriction endonuclease McrA
MKRGKQSRIYKKNMKIDVILRDDGRCAICGRPKESIHHVFYGKNRKISDEHTEFMTCLCYNCHQGTNGVHGKHGHDKDLFLKRRAQKMFEETHSHEEFMKLIGRNYLEEVEDESESAGND